MCVKLSLWVEDEQQKDAFSSPMLREVHTISCDPTNSKYEKPEDVGEDTARRHNSKDPKAC